MLKRFVAAVRVAARVHPRAIKRWRRPVRTVGVAATGVAADAAKSRKQVLAENALLRQQLIVLRRAVKRPSIGQTDRVIMVILARLHTSWRDALHLVQPDTLLRWHRDVFKHVWRRKSMSKGRRRGLPADTADLIQAMAKANVGWGAERIRGELLKLGIRVTKRTIQKYIRQVRPPRRSGQTWGTFLKNHTDDVWACDFLQLYDVWFRPIFAFFIVKHGSREVVHWAVTRSPSDEWSAQQFREVTPWQQGPRYLIRDNDDKFGTHFDAVADGAGIELLSIPPKSPNLNPICERFVGSVRRECLDHILIRDEDHLRRVLHEYVETYFNAARPHQGIDQQIPGSAGRRVADSVNATKLVVTPVLGGLHHDYRWAA